MFRILDHPTPSGADLALASTRESVEGAVVEMGTGVVIDAAGEIVAFHEGHLAWIERTQTTRIA